MGFGILLGSYFIAGIWALYLFAAFVGRAIAMMGYEHAWRNPVWLFLIFIAPPLFFGYAGYYVSSRVYATLLRALAVPLMIVAPLGLLASAVIFLVFR